METYRRDELALAAAFLLAGELLRNYFDCTLTLQIEQKCDVIVRDKRGWLTVDIYPARAGEWSASSVKTSNSPLVFVNLPGDPQRSVEFYVLTRTDLQAITDPLYEEARSKKKQPVFPGVRIRHLTTEDFDKYKSDWGRLRRALHEHGLENPQPAEYK